MTNTSELTYARPDGGLRRPDLRRFVLRAEDVEETSRVLARVFARHEPLTAALGVDEAQFMTLSRPVCEEAARTCCETCDWPLPSCAAYRAKVRACAATCGVSDHGPRPSWC